MRVFISVPIPVTDGLKGILDLMRRMDGIKAAPSTQIHMTLCFIGDMDERRIKDVKDAVERSLKDSHSSTIDIKGLGTFPNAKDPKVIWAGIDSNIPFKEISDNISKELDILKIDHDRKIFKPHITIGRVSGHPNLSPIMKEYGDRSFGVIDCDHVMVMKSELMPSGAKHTPLYSIPLGKLH
jgi:RNA 2',3'-cyclic 3'-phosphodiesterase